MKILRNDACVPRAIRGGYHAGDEIRKNSRQDEVAPAIPGAEAVDLRGFLEVGGNGHGAGDDVEEDVPLRAEKHQEHGGNLEASAEAKQKKKNNRKQGGGRNGGGHLHKRLRDARQAGIRTDGDADGNGPERAKDERGIDAQKSQRGAFQKLVIVLATKTGQFADRVENGESQTDQNNCCQQIADPAAEEAVLLRSGKSFRGAAGAKSEGKSEPVEDGLKDEAIQAEDDGSAADEIEQSGLCGAGTFDLFELELVRPNDDGPPNELIEENDDGDHGDDAPENRTGVAMARRRLKKRAEAGEAKVAIAEDEHLAGHEKKPAAGDGHHRIPDEADGGKGKVELGEALPAAETVDDRDFFELARDGFKRRVETESDVPDLAREDEQDGAELDAELAVRKDRDHGEHDSRQEAEHGDGLENIQQRNHDDFGAPGAGSDVTVGESKNQAQCVSDADSKERVKSVEREDAGILRNLDVRMDGAEPGTADRIDAKNCGADKKKNGNVDEECPAPARARGPRHRGRKRGSLGGWESEIRHGASGLSERQLAGGGVVIENFGVAAPLDSSFELAAGFALAEVFVEEVAEKFLGESAVGFSFERLLHLAKQRHIGESGLAENRFTGLNVRLSKRLAFRSDDGVALFDAEEAKQDGSVDGRE